MAGPVTWIDGSHFWYRKSVKGGNQFVLVDAEAQSRKPAFDHQKLADALSSVSGSPSAPLTLPFQEITFGDDRSVIEFAAAGSEWKCGLADYSCKKTGDAPQGGRGGRGVRAPQIDDGFDTPAEPEFPVTDGMSYESPQQGQGGGRGGRGARSGSTGTNVSRIPRRKVGSADPEFQRLLCARGQPPTAPRSASTVRKATTTPSARIAWSPDSKKLVAYRTRPGYGRQVHYIESSPTDQLQPKHSTTVYASPAMRWISRSPCSSTSRPKSRPTSTARSFPNPYNLTPPVWWKDGRGFTFEYNQRGHQVYRVIEVDAQHRQGARADRRREPDLHRLRLLVREPAGDRQKVSPRSERRQGNHLGVRARRLEAPVPLRRRHRQGEEPDHARANGWCAASTAWTKTSARSGSRRAACIPGQDPYFIHYYRINFDGTGLTPLTEGDGTTRVALLAGPQVLRRHLVARRSAAASRSCAAREDGKRRDGSGEGRRHGAARRGLASAPEVVRRQGPRRQDRHLGRHHPARRISIPSKKYPVIENIYAGPQGSFVPKTFSALSSASQALAELGFIVVQIDGMGTSNRSKAFHDVAFKNLGDAGFPDRILWHKAVAAKYPWYDITRVGIYGTSAGGQNALGRLLFHPEFYKVAVANSGCHDNRMDKIWWNEQWMGWPLGPQYAASSNVDNAHKLQGKLLLIVGEMDTNVDPASTMQVVNALIKANKKFDLLIVPGGGHGAGGDYYQHLLQDFFVHHLLGDGAAGLERRATATAAKARGE